MLRRIKEMWSAVKATVPMAHPKRSAKQQLACLPSNWTGCAGGWVFEIFCFGLWGFIVVHGSL